MRNVGGMTMGSTSLYKPRPISTRYRRERNNFNPKFYKDHNEEVGYTRVCFELVEPETHFKTPPKEPEE